MVFLLVRSLQKIGGSRLLQVKFFGSNREAFVLEKVTRISGGGLNKAVDELVQSCVEVLTSK